ncbi:MAG TPA: long-chain fatty acid--CoA ligase [Candidatus Dormibacteraeota bacterium]|nr:long-chain fatty acid--CoA ligase [Candidatus Dormibacteraeota bacterium]
MRGLMMDFPLVVPALLERAGGIFGKVEIVTRRPDRSVARSSWREIYRRSRRLANALQGLGLHRGDRVATLLWNQSEHLEAYLGVPSAGAVLHTLNPRLHPDELTFISNHAGDRFLIVDDVLFPVYEKFRDRVKFERVIVVPFGGGSTPADCDGYEELLAQASDDFSYPKLDENEAAAMCYTSGTTGRSKGVVYSHRAIVLHSLNCAGADSFGISMRDTVMPVTSLFHANGWGIPFTAAMAGTKVVLPGPFADGEGLLDLMVQERVTITMGVPTVWFGVLETLEKYPGRWKFTWPLEMHLGGAATSEALMRGFDRHGITVVCSWGMTETTPVATSSHLRPCMEGWSEEKKYAQRLKQGFPAALVEARIIRPDGTEAPHDGASVGELEVRGPWVAAAYYNLPEQAEKWSPDGWLRTGDMGHIDEFGYIKLVDRSKDLIKSGGEWISSVDLENALMGHPAVKEAAVIGVPHAKWQERPLAVVVLNQGAAAQPEELREFLAARFAKWQLPDAFVFANEIPRTSVGKFRKTALREQFIDWKWEG